MDSRRAHHFSFLHIGCGSNLLFVKDYEGMVLHSRISGMEVTAEDDGQVHVRVGAGVVWDDFAAYCVEQGWYGAENLSLIPVRYERLPYRILVLTV